MAQATQMFNAVVREKYVFYLKLCNCNLEDCGEENAIFITGIRVAYKCNSGNSEGS